MNVFPTLRGLSPASARLCLAVERFCLRRLALPRGARLLLALSGGADSTALAVILGLLRPRLGLELFALSVDHGLRPQAAEDAAYAQRLCHALEIVCTLRQADVAGLAQRQGLGLEEAGRRLRYALLEEERRAVGADFSVLGHHSRDLSEDVLLRLTRGAGWPALGGMPARDDARRILRPLLFTCPQALKVLLQECGVSWQEDASNQSPRFKRNRLRQAVLPLLRKENPSLERTFSDLWQLAQWDRDYWENTLDAALAARPWRDEILQGARSLILPGGLLAGLHPAVRLRLYLRAVRLLAGHPGGHHAENEICAPEHAKGQARARTLLALDKALRQGRGNTRFQLPGGLEARLRNGEICFCRAAGASGSRKRKQK